MPEIGSQSQSLFCSSNRWTLGLPKVGQIEVTENAVFVALLRIMTVPADEFLRRFLIHVLPKGLVRIRHFGLFANRRRAASPQRCRSLLGMPPCVDRPATLPPNRRIPSAPVTADTRSFCSAWAP